MKILILIPSKKRHLRLKVLTWEWFKKTKLEHKILVEPQDYGDYSVEGFDHLLELPENNRGLSYSLSIGKEYADANGYDTIFKLDDDIKAWKSIKKLDNKTSASRFLQIIKDIEKPLEREEIGGISFGYRNEFWHEKKWMGINQRFQSSYVVKLEHWNPGRFSKEMDMWQDFADFLAIIDKGLKVLRYGRYVQDTNVFEGEGGHSELYKARTPEKYKNTIELYRKAFPWLKFKKKDNGLIEPDMRSPMIDGRKL